MKRKISVERSDLMLEHRGKRRRITDGAYFDAHEYLAILQQRHIEQQRRISQQGLILGIFRYADHLNGRTTRTLVRRHGDALAERIFAGPEPRCKLLGNDRHQRCTLGIPRAEIAALNDGNSQSAKVPGRNRVRIHPKSEMTSSSQLLLRRLLTLMENRPAVAPVSRRVCFRQADGLNAGDHCQSLLQLLEKQPGASLRIVEDRQIK